MKTVPYSNGQYPLARLGVCVGGNWSVTDSLG